MQSCDLSNQYSNRSDRGTDWNSFETSESSPISVQLIAVEQQSIAVIQRCARKLVGSDASVNDLDARRFFELSYFAPKIDRSPLRCRRHIFREQPRAR